jgi:hypothetical protein
MRGYMQGALGALFAYGAAWWATGEQARTPLESGVRAGRVTARATDDRAAPLHAPAPGAVARVPAPVQSARSAASPNRASSVGSLPAPQRERAAASAGARDPLAGIAALPSDFAASGDMPPVPDSLRQLAEYRQLAESPAALVERVERFEPNPAQLAEFRRVAAQLFNKRPAGAEGESPWAPGGTRDGQGSLVQRTERSAR